jgi:DNA-binding NarL/FixJ family response regulator
LGRIASVLGTTALTASAAAAAAVLHRLAGNLDAAASSFEQAAALYERAGAPFETARARLDLAQALNATGQRAGAEREARLALESFQSLGAERDALRARQWLEQPERPQPRVGKPKLTARQIEILRLVAQGLSNPEIAARLRLSDHTVKRHVANLLTRLGLPSRAAAVAYAAREGLLPPR